MIPWLAPGEPFPPVEQALAHPNGLLAATLEIDAERLIEAYRHGIFPWYSAGEPVLWWSPDPRMALPTAALRVTRSLRRRMRAALHAARWSVRLDTAFEAVMRACAAPRPDQRGSWITEPLIAAYVALHERDLAHSVEVWDGSTLVAGLYGVSLGRMFYGESMFTRASDGSKTALTALVQVLLAHEVPLIDCQQATAHLASLGAREMPRAAFCRHVTQACAQPPLPWSLYRDRPLNELLLDA